MKSSLIAKVKLNNTESLTSVVNKNAFYILSLRVLSIILSFWSIKITFDFAGSQQLYGLWLTILSVISWLGLLNAGLGNGLRNKLSQAIAIGDIKNAKSYVSTSYIFISAIAVTCCLLFLVATYLIDWRKAFNAGFVPKDQFSSLLVVLVIPYFFQLILSMLNSICYAYNRSMLPALFTFISNLMYVGCLYTLKIFHVTDIFFLGLFYSSTIIIVLLIANLYLFYGKHRDIRPSVKYFNKKYVKGLMGNGVKFFFLEISSVIIFTTDSMIINQLVGSSEVTTYQLVMKLFSIFTIFSGAVMIPLWSAYTHAYNKGDIVWIKKTMKRMLKMMMLLILAIFLFSFLINPILHIWIGGNIVAPNILILVIAFYIIITIWSNIFSYLLNGINKVNGQLVTVGLGAIINIPLSIYFAKNLGLGSVGVVLATVFVLIPFAVIGPYLSYLEINKSVRYVFIKK